MKPRIDFYMVNSKNFYETLQISSEFPLCHWPIHLVQALPRLLIKTLDQRVALSLERLQLISISAEYLGRSHHSSQPLEFTNIALSEIDPLSCVTLRGDLLDGDMVTVRVAVTFFVRGAKRFFRPPEYVFHQAKYKQLRPLASNDIRAFLSLLGQDNSMLYDSDLAHLSGRSAPEIPSQMVFLLLLLQSSMVASKEFNQLHVTFFRTIKQQQPLQFLYDQKTSGFSSALATENGMAAALKA
jgi:hypothetical protein